ncbi:MAG: sulfide/dihydroorotate dehydrogenase-like FAD/NAD-binding protein [Clostridia bacterium]|nr:sulfide/dihydroorotate dehydrogenase-like FAD/NAD-binding protein [Clostridia bacterium]
MCFTAVEFVNDPNVVGQTYWYLCPFTDIKEGTDVVAPLGRRNGEQVGVVRKVEFADEFSAPYPVAYIKKIKRVLGETVKNSSFRIVKKRSLNSTVTLMDIYAPLVARKAEAGQFIILRVGEDGERIPLTVAGYNRRVGTVRIIFQIVGGTTMLLNAMNAGDCLADFVGPLGCATNTDGLKKVCIIGGGVGCAIALPIAEKLHKSGCEVHTIIGFRNKDLLILEDEFAACSDKLTVMTDDGSYGSRGLVTAPLKEAIEQGENYDEVIAIGPLIMMKFVVAVTKPYGVKTTVSMNPIMID